MKLQHALKEWAIVCEALRTGRQTLVLRKGGIAEEAGTFHLEHQRFWLYPTYVHQQEAGVKQTAAALLADSLKAKPPTGMVRLSLWAEVAGVYRLHDLISALKLNDTHIYSLETVQSRFAYKSPGLQALLLRVYEAGKEHLIQETPTYAGCKSWVALGQEFSTAGSKPVLNDDDFKQTNRMLDRLLEPTGMA